ncbi:TetR family transcriptional regulator [Streptomyces sp. NPDC026665]|uniref:TetR/AcrR family transcriptional regulator n=1 Tax=Streptomyces sp. NPDC026665 TaxID=3154798 RepID=UPI003404613D
MTTRSRGRPPGRSDARERILTAARTSFLRHGYDATTMRAIGTAADVDQALIGYYFGSKQGLFGSALSLGTTPGQIMERVLRGAPEHLPQAILETLIAAWDDPETGAPLTRLVTRAQTDPALQRALGEYVQRELTGRLATHIGGEYALERAGNALTATLGVIISRYVLKLHPLATMEPRRLVRLLAPSLAAALQDSRTG